MAKTDEKVGLRCAMLRGVMRYLEERVAVLLARRDRDLVFGREKPPFLSTAEGFCIRIAVCPRRAAALSL